MTALLQPQAEAMFELPEMQTIHGYGPTEYTTLTCCYRLPKTWSGGLSVSFRCLNELCEAETEKPLRSPEFKSVIT